MRRHAYNVGRVPACLSVHPTQDPWSCQHAPGGVRERRRNEQAGTLFLFSLLAASLLGCATPIKKQVRLESSQAVTTVLVYPVGFRWSEPLYRSFDLSERLVHAGIDTLPERLLFFGPTEFRVLRADDNHVWAATDALPLIRGLSIDPETVLALRPWVEKRMASSEKEIYSARGNKAGQEHMEETLLEGHVELVHPASREILAEFSLEVQVNPYAERDTQADPTPEVTALLERLMREAILSLRSHTVSQKTRALPELLFLPRDYLAASDEAHQALALGLSSVDTIDAQLMQNSRLQFFNPRVSGEQLEPLLDFPGGIMVKKALGPLSANDTVVSIDGRPACVSSFHRLFRNKAPVAVQVRRRDGSGFSTKLP